MVDMDTKKLKKEINSFKNLFRGNTLLKEHCLLFDTPIDAKNFLVYHLIALCLSGINYSDQYLIDIYQIIQEELQKDLILSKDLPFPEKTSFPSMKYWVDGCYARCEPCIENLKKDRS